MAKRETQGVRRAAFGAAVCFFFGFLAGCTSENDRLRAEFGEATDAKLKQIAALLDGAAELPPAATSFIERQSLEENLGLMRAAANSDKLPEELREPALARLAEAEARIEELRAAAEPELDGRVVFTLGPESNAATLLLTAGNSASPWEEFSDRNHATSGWYLYPQDDRKPKVAREWYAGIERLEYLLVIRQTDIRLPTHEGEDDQGRHEYLRGGFQGEAFLLHLAGETPAEPISSFAFLSPNPASAGSFANVEFFLPDKPEEAVAVLTTRLYGAAHEFAAAYAAGTSDLIEADHRVVNDLLGLRLERSQ